MKSRFNYFSLPVLIVSIALFFSLGCDKDDDPTPGDGGGGGNGNGVFGTLTDDRDGNTYNTIQVGEQIWMAENLAYLPSVYSPDDRHDTLIRYHVYDYFGTNVQEAKQTENYQTYGVLYNWPAAMNREEDIYWQQFEQEQGVCPTGWHLPSYNDFAILREYIIDNFHNDTTTIDEWTWPYAKALAAQTHWEESSEEDAVGNDLSANNATNFSALPSGMLICKTWNEDFQNIGVSTMWWNTSSVYDWSHIEGLIGLNYDTSDVDMWGHAHANMGLPVRCVKAIE